MFWACQRLTSKGILRRVSAIRTAVAEGSVGRGVAGCGGFEADHGALHALAGGVAERVGVEGDVVGFGAGEQRFDGFGVEGVGFEGAAQAGVDGEVGGDCERGRRRPCRSR